MIFDGDFARRSAGGRDDYETIETIERP